MRGPCLMLVAACGARAPDRAHDAGATPTATRDAVAIAVIRDAAPAPMLAAKDDPWSPNGPRPPEPPAPTEPLPPRPAEDAPEPADREVVLGWEGAHRVRAHLAIGNWSENRPIMLSGSAAPWEDEIKFNPAWNRGNVELVLAIGCGGYCDVDRLAGNIAAEAREHFRLRPERVRRWIVAPHQTAGIWSWRFDARDKIGTLREGEVAVYRILPELGGFLRCTGTTRSRGNPIWLDRIEAICRQLTFEVVP